MLGWEILFWLSVALLLHSYILFPELLSLFSKNKKSNQLIYNEEDIEIFPNISILLAAYNEEKVIQRKIESTFTTNYPLNKIEFLIGSDASTDATNQIIKEFQQKYPQLKLIEFPGRTGKSGIINELAKKASNEILILTDANVFFRPDTIFQLIKHYKNEKIALVGGNILNIRFKKDGISLQEKSYLSRENLIKYREGIVWGSMIGAFGGCYSIRKQHYAPVPPKYFMDDFYITMNVLEQKKLCIMELSAISYEDVSNKISEEFRRKVRISIGNFQNFFRYYKLLWPPWKGLGFSFLSHKVLRWLGPFFIFLAFISSGILATETLFYKILFFAQVVLLLLPVLDHLLKKLNIHSTLLRFISHFYLMNLALLVGFFKYAKGVESNIWKPTQRYQ